MFIPLPFKQYSIRKRLILLNILTTLLIIILSSIYTYQFISLEHKLLTMEQVDDLFNNILEMRRHEKNIMLQLGVESEKKAREAMQEIESYMKEVAPNINTLAGREVSRRLKENFTEYKSIFARWCANGQCSINATLREESRLIREQGQKLIDNSTELVRIKRKNISDDFKNILFWLTIMPALVFLGGAIFFFTQTKSILNRLSSLKKATKDLAAGEFKPIPTLKNPDEITNLIINFNQMVAAFEEKQEQLIQSKKMASIGTFSSGIAHEINNPLNNISLSADTLIEEFTSMEEEEILEVLDDIMIQTERASKIVRNLLDFSRAQSSEMSVMFIEYILHKSTDLIANELRIHKITLVKDIPEDLPQIKGDLQQLQQVFLNLIINAEQAIGDYGIINVRARQMDNGYIRSDICDTGPGISQEHLDQIYDPFFTTKEAGKGTGLGLAIVYSIVEKHGGYIEVASKLGEGTTFSVYLPVYSAGNNGNEST